MDNSLNWRRIYERIFSVFPAKTQKELGEALGVSQDLISNWKTGKAIPTWQILEKVVTDKHVTWQWLLTGKDTSLRDGGTIYDRIRNRFVYQFGKGLSDSELAQKLGVEIDDLESWKDGTSRPSYETLLRTTDLVGDYIDYYITGYIYQLYGEKMTAELYEYVPIYNANTTTGHAAPFPRDPYDSDDDDKSAPAYNASRPREPINFVLEAKDLPVVGKAAADETHGSRAGFFPPDPEARFEQMAIPETTSAVEIIGDSMSPVLLNGQYALLGPEYIGPYDQPKNYDIVVADVEVKDGEQDGSDTRWEGVYCKRIVDAGDIWVFLSINTTGTPFSAAKANCRIWPVIGVWFAGKGKPPED